MCAVSMVIDYGKQTWGEPQYWQLPNKLPTSPPNILGKMAPAIIEWEVYQELLRKAAEFDKLAKQPDCEDPEKQKWLDKAVEYMKKLEQNQ